MGYKAYKDNVIVKMDTSLTERKLSSGIYVPESDQGSHFGEKIVSGTVLSAGPGGHGTTVVEEKLLQVRDGRRCVEQRGRVDYFHVDVSVGERVLFLREQGEPVVVGKDVAPETFPDVRPGTELRALRESELIGVVE